MGDRNHIAHERPLDAENDITVVFYKVDRRGGDDDDNNSSGRSGDHDDDERPAERVRLHGSRGVSRRSNGDGNEEGKEEEDEDARRTDTGHGDGHLPEDGERKRLFCQPASCVSSEPPSLEDGAREGSGTRERAARASLFLRRARPSLSLSLSLEKRLNVAKRESKQNERTAGIEGAPVLRPR